MKDPLRPAYHFTAPANWLNDPNGLVYFEGEYHLFYQYHPGSTLWGPMHWGHAVSRDLLNWMHLPVALAPDENGMIFSGCAVVDWENSAGFGCAALVAIFTHFNEGRQSQSLAFSTDRGRTWSKYPGNPVLPPPPDTPDFRDPKVAWHPAAGGGQWVMLLAAGRETLFYTSPDLKSWSLSGRFGAGFGAPGGVWETPDLFELPLDGGPETRWVLTVGLGEGGPAGGSGTQYFVGNFDGRVFTSENPPECVLWMDHGADFYAPQSWSNAPDGHRLLLGWLNNWRYARQTPSSSFRGAFSLVREAALTRTECGPRLVQRPLPELARLRAQSWRWQDVELAPGLDLMEGWVIPGDLLEIDLEVEIPAGLGGFNLRLRNGVNLGYDAARHALSFERRRPSQVDFHPEFAGQHSAEVPCPAGRLDLRIYLDRCSVEVFAAGGLLTFCESFFPGGPARGLELLAEGAPLTIRRLDIHTLHPAVFQ